MDYHISNMGDDANPGTMEAPWETLARANAHRFAPGDCIYLRQGNRFAGTLTLSPENAVTTPEAGLRIARYRDDSGEAPMSSHPIIDAGDGDGIVVRNLGNITIQDINISGDGYDANQGWGVRILNDAPNAGRFANIRLERLVALGFRWAGIYVGGVPNDLPGFTAPTDCINGFSDVVITGCEAAFNMYYGIYVSGPLRPGMTDYANENVVIENCDASYNHGDKHYTANHSGSGILLDNCRHGRIENCDAHGNGAENAGLTGGPCGIWSHASDRVTISRCRSYENRTGGAADGTGFDLDGGVTNSVIEYCESWENDGPGYLMWNYENAPLTLSGNTIRNCVSTNDGRKHRYGSIHLGTSGEPIFDIYVRDCTIIQSPVSDGGGSPVCLQVEGKSNENIVFRGNKLTTSGGVPETRFPDGANGITVAP